MRDRTYVIFAAIIAVAILLCLPLSLSRRARAGVGEVLAPFQSMVAGIAGRISDSCRVLVAGHGRNGENEQLTTRIAELSEKLRQYESLARENSELRSQLGFAQKSGRTLTLCEVVGRGGSAGWWQTIRLNKGSVHGISARQAVVTMDGLVGETYAVSPHTSDVLLISDRNCKVSARFARTGAFGIVMGSSTSMPGGDPVMDMCYPVQFCRAEYVAKNAGIRKGDAVVTSGLGGLYPDNLLIGYVDSTAMHKSGLYRCAEVVPAADLQNLRHVFVVSIGSTHKAERAQADGPAAEIMPGER